MPQEESRRRIWGSSRVSGFRLGTASATIDTMATGWIPITSDNTDTGLHVYKKTADGTEVGTTVTCVTSKSSTSYFAFR